MSGELKIKVSNSEVKIVGFLDDSSVVEQVAVVDALMNAFDMRGEKRELVCQCLLSVDKAREKASEDDIIDSLDKLFSTLAKE